MDRDIDDIAGLIILLAIGLLIYLYITPTAPIKYSTSPTTTIYAGGGSPSVGWTNNGDDIIRTLFPVYINNTLYVNNSLVCTANNGLCNNTGGNSTTGPAGTNGTDGLNGTGINAIYLLNNGSLQINLTNGTNYTSTNLTGQKGDIGNTGPTGPAGTNGTNGIDGINGTNAYNITNNITNNITSNDGTGGWTNDSTYTNTSYEVNILSGNISMPTNFKIGNGATYNNAYTQVIVIGEAAQAAEGNLVIIGDGAYSQGANSICIGTNSQVNDYRSIAIGSGARVDKNTAIALGYATYVNGINGVAIGNGADVEHDQSYAIGSGATTTDTNQLMIGSGTYPLNTTINGNIYISGQGTIEGSPICTSTNGQCTSGSGNNSWNETRANTLYYPLTNPANYYNSTTLPTTPYQSNAAGWTNITNTTSTALNISMTATYSCILWGTDGKTCHNSTCIWTTFNNDNSTIAVGTAC